MALLIDPPAWSAHGRLWSHLISDVSVDELHSFARGLGIPARSFEGDHYDIPQERYACVVAAGAREVSSRDVVRALRDSGLRLTKRKGEKGVARIERVDFPDGTSASIDLIAGPESMPEGRVFAAMVFLIDSAGHVAVVHSVRRQQWGPPGGWREGEETVVDNAIRETREECGITVAASDLVPVGYERFRRAGDHGGAGLWRPGQDILQCFRVDLDMVQPSLTAELDDTSEREWVEWAEFERRCAGEFWWPLAHRVLADLAPDRDHEDV